MDQQGKVKLFRVLKVVFYCLGLPLMFMSVLALSVMFYGEAPFAGKAALPNNILSKVFIPMTGSAFYGVWIAGGIWLFLGAMQILFHYVIKNPRVRLIVVSVVLLVTMLVPVFAIDASYTKQLDTLAAQTKADGVNVEDYKTQLSYYRTVSSGGDANGRIGSRTQSFINRIKDLTKALNIGYGVGGSSNGTAGSYNSNPITYAYLGIDKNGDFKIDKKDDVEILEAPTGGDKKTPGKLVLHNVNRLKLDADHIDAYQDAYSRIQAGQEPIKYTESDFVKIPTLELDGYMPVGRGKDDGYGWKEMTLWYDESKMPQPGEGIFGQADYAPNGLLGDGFIYGLTTVLNILDTYYSARESVETNIAKYNELNPEKPLGSFDEVRADLKKKSLGYYDKDNSWVQGKLEKSYVDPTSPGYSIEKHLMYLQETYYLEGDYELTVGKLNDVLSALGSVVGTNFLFGKLAGLIDNDVEKVLNQGDTLPVILENVFGIIKKVPLLGDALGPTLDGLLKDIVGDPKDYTKPGMLAGIGLQDAKVQIIYNAPEERYEDVNQNGKFDKEIDKLLDDYNKNGEWDAAEKTTVDGVVYDFSGLKLVIQVNTAQKGEYFVDYNGDGKWNAAETYVDENKNGKYDVGEEFIDTENTWNEELQAYVKNGVWDPAEPFTDAKNGRYDEGEPFVDKEGGTPGKWDPNEEFTDLINGKWDGPEAPNYIGVELNLSSDMSFNHINKLVDDLLNTVCQVLHLPSSLLDTVLGLVGGALPVDLNNLEASVMDLLGGMYWYQSPKVLPFFAEELYVESTEDLKAQGLGDESVTLLQQIQRQMSKFEAAEYAGGKHGTAISSEIIAKAGEVGLGSLRDVRQLKTDMSYIPTMYPVLTARDMLLVFAGLVVFWTFISFVCAEKEKEYANGTAPIKVKKSKKSKKNAKTNNKVNTVEMNNAPTEENKIPVDQNTDKEVK